jgi:thymidylate kinase
VRQAYADLARREPNARVIDAARPFADVLAEARAHVEALLGAAGRPR